MKTTAPYGSVFALLIMLLALFFAGPVMAEDDDPDNGPPPHAGPPGGEGPPGRGNPPGRGGPPEGAGPPQDRGPPADRGPRLGRGPGENGGPPDDIPGFCRPGRSGSGPDGQAGLSSIALLDFSAEAGSATGKLVYRWIAPLFDFVFNARGLEPEQAYTLASIESPVICLGSGTSTADGTLHLQDAFDIGTDLPADGSEVAMLALLANDTEDCASGQVALLADEGMFYVRHVDEDDGDD